MTDETYRNRVNALAIITWNLNPGAGCAPAVGRRQCHLKNKALWTCAGMLCPK